MHFSTGSCAWSAKDISWRILINSYISHSAFLENIQGQNLDPALGPLSWNNPIHVWLKYDDTFWSGADLEVSFISSSSSSSISTVSWKLTFLAKGLSLGRLGPVLPILLSRKFLLTVLFPVPPKLIPESWLLICKGSSLRLISFCNFAFLACTATPTWNWEIHVKLEQQWEQHSGRDELDGPLKPELLSSDESEAPIWEAK